MWLDSPNWIHVGPLAVAGLHLAAAALGAALAPTLGRSLARRRHDRVRGGAQRAVPAGEGLAVSLEGVIEAEAPPGALAAVTVTRFDPLDGTELAPACGQGPGLCLVCDNGRVRVTGTVEVRGSVGGDPGDDPALLGDDPLDGAREGARRRVRVGDRVVLEGVVSPLGPQEGEAMGYRGVRPGWGIGPGAAGRVLLQVLPEVREVSRARSRALGGLVGLVVFHAAAVAFGGYALRAGKAGRGPIAVEGSRSQCRDAGRGWASLATATPWLRRAALEELSVRLRCAPGRDPSLGGRLGQLAARTGLGLRAQAQAMASVGEVRGAADLLATSGDPDDRAMAVGWYLALAEFAPAHALLERPDGPRAAGMESGLATAHLLAGDLPRAAQALRAWTARLDRLRPTDYRLRQMRDLNCLAGLLEAHAARGPSEAGFDPQGGCVVGDDPAVGDAPARALAAAERTRLRSVLDATIVTLPRSLGPTDDFDDWCARYGIPEDPDLRRWLREGDRAGTARWIRTQARYPRRALRALWAAVALGAIERRDVYSIAETELQWRVPWEPYATAIQGTEVAVLLHAAGDRGALGRHAAQVARIDRALADDVVLLGWKLIARY